MPETLRRAERWQDDTETTIRLWWEDAYSQPSHGNPCFEAVPLALHVSHLVAKHLRGGGGVKRTETGGFTLLKEPDGDNTGLALPQFTGEWDGDTLERRTALGLDPFMDDDEEGDGQNAG